jgi:amino acid transporter
LRRHAIDNGRAALSTDPAVDTRSRPLDDEGLLHRLGYAQVLFRGMGGFQNFAISFTIISILAGCLTSYFVAFERGGPVAVTWGWLLVGLMSTIIALAMAEIASSYPTAGGLYYWASKLGTPGWGWATGWFNLIGQIAVTAAIGYGLATFGTILFNYWFDYPNENKWIFFLYCVFLAAAAVINMFQVRVTALLNTVSAYWHMAGVAFIVLVLIIVPDRHQSLSYVFTETVNNSGYGDGVTGFAHPIFWFVFGLGLLMAQYTITGFDASAHLAEETREASRGAAVGMYMSVVASVIFGWILLLAVTFAIPSTDGAIENIGVVVPWIWAESMSQGWAEALLFICVVAQFFCVTASVTSASRMMFAFSRDRAVPGHPLWSRVARNRVPRNAVWAIAVLAGILMIPAIPRRLRRRYRDRRDRALHRVHPPGDPALSPGRQVRARGLEPRTPLQVDRRDRDRLGGADHDPVRLPAVQGRSPLGGRLQLGADELHRAVVCGNRPRLRRLVGALGQELVRRAGTPGLRGGARADRARAHGPGRHGKHHITREVDQGKGGALAPPFPSRQTLTIVVFWPPVHVWVSTCPFRLLRTG